MKTCPLLKKSMRALKDTRCSGSKLPSQKFIRQAILLQVERLRENTYHDIFSGRVNRRQVQPRD